MRFCPISLSSALLLLMLVACASGTHPVRPDAFAEMRKIGVISLAANEFYRQYAGFTLLASESDKVDISAWRVDDDYELQMQHTLGRLGRFAVVRVPYERADLLSIYHSHALTNARTFHKADWSAVQEKLKAIASANSLDGIVVFVRRESGDFLAGTNQVFGGAGFYAAGLMGSNRASVLHLLGLVALIDGRTGSPIATKFLARSQEGRTGTVARAAPMLIVAPELTRVRLSELGDARTADIRRWLITLPTDAWDPTFRALFTDGPD